MKKALISLLISVMLISFGCNIQTLDVTISTANTSIIDGLENVEVDTGKLYMCLQEVMLSVEITDTTMTSGTDTLGTLKINGIGYYIVDSSLYDITLLNLSGDQYTLYTDREVLNPRPSQYNGPGNAPALPQATIASEYTKSDPILHYSVSSGVIADEVSQAPWITELFAVIANSSIYSTPILNWGGSPLDPLQYQLGAYCQYGSGQAIVARIYRGTVGAVNLHYLDLYKVVGYNSSGPIINSNPSLTCWLREDGVGMADPVTTLFFPRVWPAGLISPAGNYTVYSSASDILSLDAINGITLNGSPLRIQSETINLTLAQ